MIMTGQPIGAERAHALGMVNRLAEGGTLLDEALALAESITRGSPIAVRESLLIARSAEDLPEDELRALTLECVQRNRATEDIKEGPRAFLQKRTPVWQGR
ncbi:enoyl-CoA hydratase-related protein [Ramlibacter sp.]|uniref:enoyl-CoA hydratase-related protein n=1 Tax=Ramlibacter sp. TaxID=1917967 RepID=UPI003D120D96